MQIIETASMEVLTFNRAEFQITGTRAVRTWRYPEIDQDVYSDGTVIVYLKDGDRWTALPTTQFIGWHSIAINFAYAPGTLELVAVSSTNPIAIEDVPDGSIKVVVIPPGQ